MAGQVLDPDDERPPFLQVAERLRQQIVEGTYAPGAKLQNALRELRGDGLIVSRQGSGVFVRTRHSPRRYYSVAQRDTRVPLASEIPVADIERLIEELEDRREVLAELSGASATAEIIERIKALIDKR